jgi:hypothetical protein
MQLSHAVLALGCILAALQVADAQGGSYIHVQSDVIADTAMSLLADELDAIINNTSE